MCTSCCIAIPHDNRVKAIGKMPLERVVRSPEISPPVVYIASTTGMRASIMTNLYFAILVTSCCFCTCAVICFHLRNYRLVFTRDQTFWNRTVQKLNFFTIRVHVLNTLPYCLISNFDICSMSLTRRF